MSPQTTSRPGMRLSRLADHQGARARQFAQAVKHSLGTGLLDQRDRDRCCREKDQDDGLFQIADDEVDGSGPEKQREHGLAQDVGGNA